MMLKKSKMIKLLCSAIIGVLLILVTVLGLNLGGVVSFDQVGLTIRTADLEALYDGTPLTNHRWELVGGSLKEGHQIKAEFSGSQTFVGQCLNSAEFTVVDRNGNDVTAEYKIKTKFGVLAISPRMLVISSASGHKVYDGLPLRAPEYVISEDCDGLVQGHTVLADIVGEISMPGYTLNTINSITILDENGEDVTRNYQLTVKEGLLGVTMSEEEGMGMGGITVSGSLLDNGNENDNDVFYMVRANTYDQLYLKTQSFGDYNGKGWELSSAYEGLIEDKYSAHYMASFTFSSRKSQSYSVEIVPMGGPYALPYYSAPLETEHSIQLSDTVIKGDASDPYTVNYYHYVGDSNFVSGTVLEYEKEYRKHVYANYLTIDDMSRDYMQSIITQQGFSTKDVSIINKVAKYIQSSAIYNMEYDKALDNENNIAVAFLSEYKEGVCRHYAAAATLLFRTMGIPARYTVGFVTKATSDQWTMVTGENAHAWVEVYVDGLGWVQVEVTGSSSDMDVGAGIGGSLSSSKPNVIKVTPTVAEKVYDGTFLYHPNTVTGLENLEKMGYTYKAVVLGSQRELGISSSTISEIYIYDPQGNDVTKSFNLKLRKGRMHVYSKVIYFDSQDYDKQYDGKELSTGTMVGGELLEGHRIEVKSTASCDAGYRLNTYNVTVYNSSGTDVTYMYKVVRDYGYVKISRAPLTIKAGDAEKKYDGKALTCDEYSIVEGELISGDKVVYISISGRQTEVGRSDNIVSQIIILSAKNRNATGNYEIKFQTGKLKVSY